MKSDLSMVQEFGESLRPAEDHPPAELRHRVTSGMQMRVRRRGLLPRLTGVRLPWRVVAPAGMAAAIAAALVTVQMTGIGAGAPAPPGHGSARGAEVGTGLGGASPAPSGAGVVLRLAAQTAAATPVLKARPDQFLFIETIEVESTVDLGRDGDGRAGGSRASGPHRTRTWLSVDGTRDGLVLQDPAPGSDRTRPSRTQIDGCTDGLRAETVDRPETTPKVACTPEPAYRADRLPTDPGGLLAYVNRLAAAEPAYVAVTGERKGYVRLSTGQRAFQEIADLLYFNHSPAVQSAAIRAAEQIPGVQVRAGVADASGRPGVAVTRTEAGTRHELVFNPTTYAYLGHNLIAAPFDVAGAEIVRKPGPGTASIRIGPAPKPGDVIYKSALLRIAIVDEAGRRP